MISSRLWKSLKNSSDGPYISSAELKLSETRSESMRDDAQWWANKHDDRGPIHYDPRVMLSKEY